MNYLNFIAVLCLLLIINACCVTRPNCDPEGGNFTYGPDISYRSSKYVGSDAQGDETKRVGSIGIGGWVHWVFCEDYPDMGFLSGLYYNQHGARYNYSDSDKSKDRISYLTLPIIFTYQVYEGVRVEVGPDLSFLLAAKEKNEYFGETTTYNFTDDTRKVQLGYHIALAYTHQPSGLGGFLRWNGGFTKVPTSEYDTNIKNGGFSVGARYRINHLFYNK